MCVCGYMCGCIVTAAVDEEDRCEIDGATERSECVWMLSKQTKHYNIGGTFECFLLHGSDSSLCWYNSIVHNDTRLGFSRVYVVDIYFSFF